MGRAKICPRSDALPRDKAHSKDTSQIPGRLVPFEPIDPALRRDERILAILRRRESPTATSSSASSATPVDESDYGKSQGGTTEIWAFANTTGDIIPCTSIFVHFQVLNRQPFDVRNVLLVRQTGLHRPVPLRRRRTSAGDEGHCQNISGYVTGSFRNSVFCLPDINPEPGTSIFTCRTPTS